MTIISLNVKNAKAMRDEFAKMGYDVSDTDTHMFFIDFSKSKLMSTQKQFIQVVLSVQ